MLTASNPFPGFLFINITLQAEKQMKLKMHLLLNKSLQVREQNAL